MGEARPFGRNFCGVDGSTPGGLSARAVQAAIH